jgi:hypothetical protein
MLWTIAVMFTTVVCVYLRVAGALPDHRADVPAGLLAHSACG